MGKEPGVDLIISADCVNVSLLWMFCLVWGRSRQSKINKLCWKSIADSVGKSNSFDRKVTANPSKIQYVARSVYLNADIDIRVIMFKIYSPCHIYLIRCELFERNCNFDAKRGGGRSGPWKRAVLRAPSRSGKKLWHISHLIHSPTDFSQIGDWMWTNVCLSHHSHFVCLLFTHATLALSLLCMITRLTNILTRNYFF